MYVSFLSAVFKYVIEMFSILLSSNTFLHLKMLNQTVELILFFQGIEAET